MTATHPLTGNDLTNVPAAACPRCGGWTSCGGCSQYSNRSTPQYGRTGCVCCNPALVARIKNPVILPVIGTSVELGSDSTAWTVADHEGDYTVVLTRHGVAPGTSMDRIMGNGPAPRRGTHTMRFGINADGTGERGKTTFAIA